jgi:hypothetical protein
MIFLSLYCACKEKEGGRKIRKEGKEDKEVTSKNSLFDYFFLTLKSVIDHCVQPLWAIFI